MNRMIKALSLLMVLALLVGCGTEPAGTTPTEEWIYEINGTKIIGTHQGEQSIVFDGNMNGGFLQAVAAPDRLYVLWDDTLYSMDADGGNRYQVDSKCYNPGEASGIISDASDMHTLGYYHGYVYYIVYGTTSKLKRFPVGGNAAEVLAKNSASKFTISPEGILTTFLYSDGKYIKAYEFDLDEL